MNYIKNQHGYALLVVLLIITVIGIFAPILVNNVLSSSKQFSMVEEQMQHEKLANMAYIYIDKAFESIRSEADPEDLVGFFKENLQVPYEVPLGLQHFIITEPVVSGTNFSFEIITTVNGKPQTHPEYIVNINDYFN
ncbi:type II secretion system protein [Alkalihalophilus pseudofirmus]|uniref:type II secretion system protein n=1 Tax=Alkalihalophilus pseudofirmus TaxID=79885 RepID=UPI00259BD387|nr:type II secretion system protein [Alkalihalophilus pseudofirmus]WEG17381.1 type II secretion system protein [Alkalihalophilus pseudofirmus]